MDRIFFYNPQGFEPWDWRNPEGQGIGGSETCQVEMSRRLALAGYDVTSYAPVPDDCTDSPEGVKWLSNKDVDTTQPGLWIIFRSPKSAELFEPEKNNQRLWHVSQDVAYFEGAGGAYTEDRCEKFERIIALCPTHRDYLLKNYDFLKPEQVVLSSNGISVEKLPKFTHERNNNKLIWSSSPDRGLKELLYIFERVRYFNKYATLDVYYGFDNWNKVIHSAQKNQWQEFLSNISFSSESEKLYFESLEGHEIEARKIAKAYGLGLACPQERMRDEIIDLLKQPGVTWMGRKSQREIWEAFTQANIWCYPTWFSETSCITCMEAQALGAIPITNPFWAVGHNVAHGVFIQGATEDALVKCRYVAAIIKLMNDQRLQEKIRNEMIPWARTVFDWEVIVRQWIGWINGDENIELFTEEGKRNVIRFQTNRDSSVPRRVAVST